MNAAVNEIINSGAEEAFYVCNLDTIKIQHELWLKCLPRVKPFYAVKCNHNRYILETMASIGVNFECRSKTEMEHLLKNTKVSPERILYSYSTKSHSHLRYAETMKIHLTTADCESELQKIQRFMPSTQVLLSIRLDNSNNPTDQITHKFGCDPVNEAPELLRLAKTLNLQVAGVQFHLGSNISDKHHLHTILKHSRAIFQIGTSLGFTMNIIDIGGGFVGLNPEQFKKVSDVVNQGLQENFPEPNVKIIAEPGRFYVENCMTLACNITSVKHTKDNSGHISHIMYYIDDGRYGSFMCVNNNEFLHPETLKTYKNDQLIDSSVWGPTADNTDFINKKCSLPILETGDWLLFHNMGAYTISTSTAFNGFTTPQIHYLSNPL